MMLINILILIFAGAMLGIGLIKSKMFARDALALLPTKQGREIRSQFYIIIAVFLILQVIFDQTFSGTNYGGILQLCGSVIFGISAAALGYCPLGICQSGRHEYTKLEIFSLFIAFGLGVKLAQNFTPINGSTQVAFFPLYLDNLFNYAIYIKGIILAAVLLVFYIEFDYKNLKSYGNALVIGASLIIVQKFNLGIGLINFFDFIEFKKKWSIGEINQFAFYIGLFLVLAVPLIASASKKNFTLIGNMRVAFLGLIMGIGGAFAGGCTLSSFFEGVPSLSIGGIINTLMIIVSYVVTYNLLAKKRQQNA